MLELRLDLSDALVSRGNSPRHGLACLPAIAGGLMVGHADG